ncbi:MAG: RlmE family RNA methyltransferase [Alphaproteobacteria bacterium]|nr:RlmE family RNA methyltransferase [Alphaproteobacteria bacterium]
MPDQEKISSRNQKVKLKKNRGRTLSSKTWLERQLNDPYVREAKKLGYRSRAAFKLIELNEKFNFLKEELRVVDLGAAPGGWTQIVAQKVNTSLPNSQIIGIDLLKMDPIQGTTLILGDFTEEETVNSIKTLLNGPVDLVLSDMAPSTTGHKKTDHLRIIGLIESAFFFAQEVLKEDGCFVAKVFQGGAESSFLKVLKKSFGSVKHFKPNSSRKESSELYLVAQNFKKEINKNNML